MCYRILLNFQAVGFIKVCLLHVHRCDALFCKWAMTCSKADGVLPIIRVTIQEQTGQGVSAAHALKITAS